MEKKSLLILTVLVLCVAISINDGESATYYLDAVNGKDANSGTSGQPWKTLNRAYTWYSGSGPKVQEGDVVLFRDGDYGTFRENTGDGQARLFYRNNWITYKADAGHTPVLNSIDILNADKWAPIEHGRSYLDFEGFTILDGAAAQFTSYFQIRGCNITVQPKQLQGFYAPYVPPGSEGVMIKTGHYITIENNEIQQTYRGIGVVDYSSNVVISGNTIHHVSEDGIVCGGTTTLTIENNTIYDHNKFRNWMPANGTINGTFQAGETVVLQGTAAQGIYDHTTTGQMFFWQTSETTIWEQWLADKSRIIVGQQSGATVTSITDVDPDHSDCITISADNGVILRNNTLLRSMGGGEDGQALKPDRAKNVEMYNNLIVAAVGIIGPYQSDNFNMYNNTIWCDLSNPSNHSIEIYYGDTEPTIINNMYNNIISKLVFRADRTYYSRVINHGNNIFGNNPITGSTQAYPFSPNATELVNYNINSLFVDPSNNDFHLKAGSAAIDFGDQAHAPATDILSYPRDAKPDAGCYEYGAKSLKGDLNKDGKVNIQDVQACVNHILGTQDWGTRADVNRDGKADRLDMEEIIKIILEE